MRADGSRAAGGQRSTAVAVEGIRAPARAALPRLVRVRQEFPTPGRCDLEAELHRQIDVILFRLNDHFQAGCLVALVLRQDDQRPGALRVEGGLSDEHAVLADNGARRAVVADQQ